MLELIVNQVSVGESIVVLRDKDVIVPITALTQAGLNGFSGRREPVGEQEFVSLASLAPDLTFAVDELDLRLNITASPALLGRTIRDLWRGTPPNLVYRRDTSSYVNYSANWHTGNHADLFTESAVGYRGASIYNTFSATERSALRGLTSITIDRRRRLQRWTVGDSLAYSGPLGGDAWIGGVSVTKEFSIDPYYVRYPTLSLSTPIAIPSVMEVQVNGQVVSQERVAPGRLDVRNLPLTLGRNDARIIVRDAFGQTRELSSTYYLTTTALAAGVQDYQYNVGFRRLGVGEKNWDYRTPVLFARHRVGVTDSLTAGGRVELHPGRLFSGGPSVNVRLPFGELEAGTSVSRRNDEWGSGGAHRLQLLEPADQRRWLDDGGQPSLRDAHAESGERRPRDAGKSVCQHICPHRREPDTAAFDDENASGVDAGAIGSAGFDSRQPKRRTDRQRDAHSRRTGTRA